MPTEITVPSADFHVELVQSGQKAAIAATGAKARDMLMVPIDQIKIVAGLNIRIHDDDYEEHIEEVKNSILQNGFYQHFPLSGYAGKEGEETFIYCTGGFTRLEAAKRAILAGAPIEALPVVLKPPGTSMLDLTLALDRDNANHPLKPYERAIVIKRMVGYGAEEADVATKMGISGQYVTDLLFMLSLPNTIQQMIIKGQVSAGHAVVVARKEGAGATKVLQAAAGLSADGLNGSTAPGTTGRATAARTGTGGRTTISKKTYISAIVYALALPDGLDWLKRWHNGETDAVKELASTAKPKRVAAAKKPKKAVKLSAKAKKAAAAARASARAAVAASTAPPAEDDAPL